MSNSEQPLRKTAWSVIIADDEPLARTRLRGLLERHDDFTIVAECAHGGAVLQALERHAADLLFLDIRMPQLDGVAVVEALRARAADTGAEDAVSIPAIVFVTAYDVHAAQAFDLEAVDYLVKPVDIDRFDRAILRVAQHLRRRDAQVESHEHDASATLANALDALRRIGATTGYPTRFTVRDAKGLYFVATADIERAEAEGNYVALLSGGKRHLIRETMHNLEARLDPAIFVRVHRSAIVRIDCIKRMEPWGHGEYLLTLTDGTRMSSSRTCSAGLKKLLR